MNDLIENATIVYKNGFKKICEAISITEKGVYTGFIKSTNDDKEEFVNNSYIPLDQIEKIMIFNEKGKLKNLNFGKE